MSRDGVFTSHRTSVAVVGLVLIGTILLFTQLFLLSPIKATAEHQSEIMLAQPAPTTLPDPQTATAIFLPLIAHASTIHVVEHEEAPPALVIASSDHSGHSATPPPAANKHTFVADRGGHLDG